MRLAKVGGEFFEPLGASGGEQHVVALGGEVRAKAAPMPADAPVISAARRGVVTGVPFYRRGISVAAVCRAVRVR